MRIHLHTPHSLHNTAHHAVVPLVLASILGGTFLLGYLLFDHGDSSQALHNSRQMLMPVGINVR